MSSYNGNAIKNTGPAQMPPMGTATRLPAMARPGLTTTQRGLGYAHQKHKRELLAALRPGDTCWRCGAPMWPHQNLERDHLIDRYYGGADGPAVLAHASCNRRAGQRLATRIRMAKRAMHTIRNSAPSPSRNW